MLKPHKINLQEFNILCILNKQKGTPTCLAGVHEKMPFKMSNSSRIIDKLIEKKLVKKQIAKSNRRKLELFITTKGKNLYSSLATEMGETFDNLFKNLNFDQKEQFQIQLSLIEG